MKLGTMLGPYRIESELGAGGMGTVYRATVGDAVVALKVVHPHLLETDDAVARFHREIEIGKSIRHPNVVATLDGGAAAGRMYLAMELVEGQTLQALGSELQRVPEELCRHIGREVTKGLAAIHAAGAIHRDIKPDNVLITDDHVVKLMDLGVARMMDDALRLSQTGAFVGSLRYAAPECFNSDFGLPDHRADLHGLGLLLYELATGDAPYAALDLHGSIRQVLEKYPRRLGEVNPQLSPFFEEVVHTLLVKDPRGRFATASDLLQVLEHGEGSAWWGTRAAAMRVETKRPLRRIRIPRETEVYGRDEQLGQLRACFDRASAGDGHVVLLDGEAGIGKSRVVDELIAQLHADGQDLNFLFGSYPPGGAATVSGAWSTAYREQFGVAGSAAYLSSHTALVPAFDALLSGDAPPPGVATLSKQSLQACFVQSTYALAAERTTVVLIDDLHFAPEEGRALFSALAVAVPGHRVLLIGTSRPGSAEQWHSTVSRHDHTTRIALDRLGPKDLVRLLGDLLRSPDLGTRLAGQIGLRSDGNPFFVLEIVRGLREGNFITQTEDGSWVTTRVLEELSIPSSVLDIVNARVAELDDEERDLVDVAACCGFEFDPSLIAEALGVPLLSTLKRFAQIERRYRLVRSAGRQLQFDHHQIQESLLSGLLEQLREQYHSALADALLVRMRSLEAGGEPRDGALSLELCEHLVQAGREADAVRYVASAMTHLEQGYLHGRSAALMERLLAVPGLLSGITRPWALLRLIACYDLLGRSAPQHAACLEAEAVATEIGNDVQATTAAIALATVLHRMAKFDEAEAALGRARERASAAGLEKLAAAATVNLGGVLFSRGRLSEARNQLEIGREIAQRVGHDVYVAIADMKLGMVHATERELDAAQKNFERALAFYRAKGDRRSEAAAIGCLANVFRMRGDVELTRTHDEQFLEIARDIGDRSGEQTATANLGTVYLSEGRLVDARRLFERALQLAHEIEDPMEVASSTGYLADLCVCEGRVDEAVGLHLESLALHRAIGAHQHVAMECRDLGALLVDLGRQADAMPHLHAGRELAEEHGYAFLLPSIDVALGRCHAAAGDVDAARAAFTAAFSSGAAVERIGDVVRARCYEACLPGGDVDAALALAEDPELELRIKTRRVVLLLLWKATGDRTHLDAAKRLLDEALAKVPASMHALMLEHVPTNREIAAAYSAA